MANTKRMSNLKADEQYMTIVTPKVLKKQFEKRCHSDERTMSATLRFLMKAYAENKLDLTTLAA